MGLLDPDLYFQTDPDLVLDPYCFSILSKIHRNFRKYSKFYQNYWITTAGTRYLIVNCSTTKTPTHLFQTKCVSLVSV